MSRFNQTIARIASGLTVIGALIWLLWPYDLQFIDNPEAWFVLCTAVVVWLATEFKQSEALIALKPTKSDEQFARRLVDLHQGKLRHLLLDADLWRHVDVEIYQGMWSLIEDFENGRIFLAIKKYRIN